MRDRFKSAREDGRTYVQVVLDFVSDSEPGTCFSYDSLCNVLSEGSPKRFGKEGARQVVLHANKKLLTIHQRTLRNVRGEGYKLAHAFEHMDLADVRKSRANRQMDYALNLLNNVDWDAMDENQRKAHMAQLALTSAVINNQRALDARLSRVEKAIGAVKDKALTA